VLTGARKTDMQLDDLPLIVLTTRWLPNCGSPSIAMRTGITSVSSDTLSVSVYFTRPRPFLWVAHK
jgi:hypothetical protein